MTKRVPGGSIPTSSLPPLPPPLTTPSQRNKRRKMSEDTLSHGENYDYYNDVGATGTIGSPEHRGSTPPCLGNAGPGPRRSSIQALDIEIAEKQLQLLQKKRVLELEEATLNCPTYSPSEYNKSSGQPSYARDQKSRRRLALKQQQSQDASVRDAGEGSKTCGGGRCQRTSTRAEPAAMAHMSSRSFPRH